MYYSSTPATSWKNNRGYFTTLTKLSSPLQPRRNPYPRAADADKHIQDVCRALGTNYLARNACIPLPMLWRALIGCHSAEKVIPILNKCTVLPAIHIMKPIIKKFLNGACATSHAFWITKKTTKIVSLSMFPKNWLLFIHEATYKVKQTIIDIKHRYLCSLPGNIKK